MTTTDADPQAARAPALVPLIGGGLVYLAAACWVLATGERLGVWAFLVVVVPLAIYVAWSDLAHMKIPNPAVLLCLGAFLLIGPLVLPWGDYGWRIATGAIVLVVGFLLNMIRVLGAGDAKFAAAMALYIAPADAAFFAFLMAAMLIGAFVAHRALRAIPAVRRLAPEWQSWTHEKFPMGLALGPTLATYIAVAALYGG